MPFTKYASLTNTINRSTIADGDHLDSIFVELSGRDDEVSGTLNTLKGKFDDVKNLLPSDYDNLWNTEHIHNFNNTLLGDGTSKILGAKRNAKTLALTTDQTLEFTKIADNKYALKASESKPVSSYYEANKYWRKLDTQLSNEETFIYASRNSNIANRSFVYGGVNSELLDGIVIAPPRHYASELNFIDNYNYFDCGATDITIDNANGSTTNAKTTCTAKDNSILLDYRRRSGDTNKSNSYSENNSITIYSETSANDHSIAIKGAIAGASAIAMFGSYARRSADIL